VEYTPNIIRFSKTVFSNGFRNSNAEESLFLNIQNGKLVLKLAKYCNKIWSSVAREEMCQSNLISGLVNTIKQQFILKAI
jgi:hypothetical protein